MKKDKIKIGLLVVHITDDNLVRQKMVVTHLYSDDIRPIACEWITKTGKLKRKEFEPDVLEPYFKSSE